jgi:hypothetical protein
MLPAEITRDRGCLRDAVVAFVVAFAAVSKARE